jgi:Spy/CpxP family protein refolding chaperone
MHSIRSIAASAFLSAGIAAALSASHALGANDAARAKARAFGVLPVAEEAPLDALPLTDARRDEIERIEAREADRMGALRRALAVTEIELRRAELAEPFDEERVNALVAQQAELRGYLRGAESRVVAEIALCAARPCPA